MQTFANETVTFTNETVIFQDMQVADNSCGQVAANIERMSEYCQRCIFDENFVENGLDWLLGKWLSERNTHKIKI